MAYFKSFNHWMCKGITLSSCPHFFYEHDRLNCMIKLNKTIGWLEIICYCAWRKLGIVKCLGISPTSGFFLVTSCKSNFVILNCAMNFDEIQDIQYECSKHVKEDYFVQFVVFLSLQQCCFLFFF